MDKVLSDYFWLELYLLQGLSLLLPSHFVLLFSSLKNRKPYRSLISTPSALILIYFSSYFSMLLHAPFLVFSLTIIKQSSPYKMDRILM